VEPRESWSFHLPHGLLAVLCAVLVHGLVLAAVWTWIGLGGGLEGPVLMALELSGAADGPDGGGTGAERRDMSSFSSGESSLLPLLTPNLVPSPALVGRKTAPSSAPSVQPEKPVSPPVRPPLAPARTEPVRVKSTQPAPRVTKPADDTDGPKLAAGSTALSGNDPSPGQDNSGETGRVTGMAEPGAGETGSGQGGDSVGHASAGDGALLDFGAPGGPEIVRLVRPAYPREARRLGKEGLVILKLSLEASGEVGAIEVLQSAGHGMDEAARKAVQQSRFRAATRGGRPVGCQAILPVRFTLR